VGADGAVSTVRDNDVGTVFASCYAARGEGISVDIPIANYDPINQNRIRANVARSWGNGHSAIAISVRDTSASSSYSNYVVFLDENCGNKVGPIPLDPDLANAGINREADVMMDLAGNSHFLNEHQTARQFRLISYGPGGVFQQATTVGAGVCGNAGLTRTLDVNQSTGNILVACESTQRAFRRFQSDHTPIDSAWIQIPNSRISFGSHHFSAKINSNDQVAYWGEGPVADVAVLRLYNASGTLVFQNDNIGAVDTHPNGVSTSTNDFILSVDRPDGSKSMRIDPTTFSTTNRSAVTNFKLDASDRTYHTVNQSIVRGTL
jgi:hypothetical protein